MPNIKVITGAPCSGKTTYVQDHIGPKDLCYDFDRIAAAISFKEAHDLGRDHLQNTLLNFRESLITDLEQGKVRELETVWLIAADPSEKFRRRLDALNAEYIPMDTPLETCIERLAGDESRQDKAAWEKAIHSYFQEKVPSFSEEINLAHPGRNNLEEPMEDLEIIEQQSEPITDPAVTGVTGKNGEKLFTQEQVNEIVRKRLATAVL